MNLSRSLREAYTIFFNNSNYIENHFFCQRKFYQVSYSSLEYMNCGIIIMVQELLLEE
jgi:hypothetical protein